jgi:hypothetical protein
LSQTCRRCFSVIPISLSRLPGRQRKRAQIRYTGALIQFVLAEHAWHLNVATSLPLCARSEAAPRPGIDGERALFLSMKGEHASEGRGSGRIERRCSSL